MKNRNKQGHQVTHIDTQTEEENGKWWKLTSRRVANQSKPKQTKTNKIKKKHLKKYKKKNGN